MDNGAAWHGDVQQPGDCAVNGVLVAALASLAGYALVRFRFRFALAIFLLFVITMQAPVPVIPLYTMLVRLRLTDSYIGLILPLVSGSMPLAIFFFRAFFDQFRTSCTSRRLWMDAQTWARLARGCRSRRRDRDRVDLDFFRRVERIFSRAHP